MKLAKIANLDIPFTRAATPSGGGGGGPGGPSGNTSGVTHLTKMTALWPPFSILRTVNSTENFPPAASLSSEGAKSTTIIGQGTITQAVTVTISGFILSTTTIGGTLRYVPNYPNPGDAFLLDHFVEVFSNVDTVNHLDDNGHTWRRDGAGSALIGSN